MEIASGSHTIGPDNGRVLIRTYKDGVGAKLAHDLLLTATRWSGTVDVNADDPSASSATVTVDARSIEIVEATGGVKGLSDKDRKTIDKNINKDVLDTANHTELTFASTSVSGAAPEFAVAGDMTIAGTTRPVAVTVRVDGGTLSATASISQANFGIKPFSAMMGAIKLRDDVELELQATLPTG